MSSPWEHNICAPCYSDKFPGRSPHKLKPQEAAVDIKRCCFCGKTTTDGIMVREDPKILECGGNHESSDRS